jgi:UDP-glucuronate decarboxylase
MNSKETVLGPINLGNPTERTVRDLAELIITLTNSTSKIVHLDLPSDDPKQRKPDIQLARKELDWSPTTDIETGLGETISYFRGILN